MQMACKRPIGGPRVRAATAQLLNCLIALRNKVRVEQNQKQFSVYDKRKRVKLTNLSYILIPRTLGTKGVLGLCYFLDKFRILSD